MNKSNTYLTYNVVNDNGFLKGTTIDHKGLSIQQVNNAINEYIINQDELRTEIRRLNSLLDNVMNERKYYKAFYEREFEKRNSGY